MDETLMLAMMAQREEWKLLAGQEVTRDVPITMRPQGGLKVQLICRTS